MRDGQVAFQLLVPGSVVGMGAQPVAERQVPALPIATCLARVDLERALAVLFEALDSWSSLQGSSAQLYPRARIDST